MPQFPCLLCEPIMPTLLLRAKLLAPGWSCRVRDIPPPTGYDPSLPGAARSLPWAPVFPRQVVSLTLWRGASRTLFPWQQPAGAARFCQPGPLPTMQAASWPGMGSSGLSDPHCRAGGWDARGWRSSASPQNFVTILGRLLGAWGRDSALEPR